MNLTQRDWDFHLKNDVRTIIEDETNELRLKVSTLERELATLKAQPRQLVQKTGIDTDMLAMIGTTVKAAFTQHVEKELAPVLTRISVCEALINASRGFMPIAPPDIASKTTVTKRGPKGEIEEFVKVPATFEEIEEAQKVKT